MKWPKTHEGLVELIIEQLSKAETTYVSFCKEMEMPQPQKELNYFCNNRCIIHKEHVSHQLFCMPFSCLELIRQNRSPYQESLHDVLLRQVRTMLASRRSERLLVDLIVPQLGQTETTYVSFCKDMESAKNDRSPEGEKLFRSFCNKSCEVHRLQSTKISPNGSHQLVCLPFSCLELLKKKKEGKNNGQKNKAVTI